MASPDDVWLVDFGDPFPGEPARHRPAVVVGPHPIFGAYFPFVFVVPMTTTRRDLAIHVEVEADHTSGLDATSFAQCELLRSVSRRRLVHRLGRIAGATSTEIDLVIRHLLGH